MKKLILLLTLISSLSIINAQNFSTTIERNNVRAHAVSGGLLFNNPGNGGGFEAPKDAGNINNPLISIYSSTLWLGAIDGANNQYVAAQTYRQSGTDYKVGPINTFSDSLARYNKLWRITKEDVESSIVSGIPTDNVTLWPGVFNTVNGVEKLAPFFDANGNGIYDPMSGDYPIFPGDEALFFIYNDDVLHTESGGNKLNAEIKGFVYQYKSNDKEFLNNTVFVDYYITNKSNREYALVNAGIWTDFDLGFYADDRIGTDINRNLYYAYNANDSDAEYGPNPPAIGVTFLNIPMSSSMLYNNTPSNTGNPLTSEHYYNYLNGLWKDGTSMSDVGNGYKTGGNVTKFAFSGNPCSQTGWTEAKGNIAEGDRRMLGTASFNNFKPKETKKISVAYTWSRSNLGGSIPSLCKLFSQVDSLKGWVNVQPPLSVKTNNKIEVNIYPNPASQKVFIDFDNKYENIAISVFDIAGKLVLTTSEKTINVSNLTQGLYFIKGKVGERYFTKKLQVK